MGIITLELLRVQNARVQNARVQNARVQNAALSNAHHYLKLQLSPCHTGLTGLCPG